jgi:hypothetical protein
LNAHLNRSLSSLARNPLIKELYLANGVVLGTLLVARKALLYVLKLKTFFKLNPKLEDGQMAIRISSLLKVEDSSYQNHHTPSLPKY